MQAENKHITLLRSGRIRPKSLPLDHLRDSISDAIEGNLGAESLNVSIDWGSLQDSTNSCNASETSLPVILLGDNASEKDRIHCINEAIKWLREELNDMKSQDKKLAKTMIDIRAKIQQYRVELQHQKDTGYNSDETESSLGTDESKSRPDSTDSDRKYWPEMSASHNFLNNKRASWVI